MKVLPKFSSNDITRLIAVQKQRFEQAVINRLIRIGEQFVTDARSIDTYKDQTSNLRSSIGYIILKNGQQIDLTNNGFDAIGTGKDGAQKGLKVVRELAKDYPSGLVLLVVAGMEYAFAVESGHRKTTTGYYYSVYPKDVLTGSGKIATERLKKAIAKLSAKT